MAIPITIITGFLGSGKTTLILNLLPQLPQDYKLALLKNEYGDVKIDSQLAEAASISGVKELEGGCFCCNLVGQLGDGLETLRKDLKPDRIIVETSGSALPSTLVLEVNQLIKNGGPYTLDGVISVIDVENWTGYEDTSYTVQVQARHTDLIIYNKWELVDERRFDICVDHVGDLGVETPSVKSDKGKVGRDIIFGIDGSLARDLQGHKDDVEHEHGLVGHSSEVDVLSCSVESGEHVPEAIDLGALLRLLTTAPKEEVYRIKAKIWADQDPSSFDGIQSLETSRSLRPYLLNWAFGRWTFTLANSSNDGDPTSLQMTIITARDESNKWQKRIQDEGFLGLKDAVSEMRRFKRIS